MSRFEPYPLPVARYATQSEVRSSPVYAGHSIKPLKELAGACSLGQDRGHPAKPKTPATFLQSDRFPSFRAIHADVLKGMISYLIGFLECEHGRASNGQHARKRLFSEYFRPCQVLIRESSTDRYFYQNWPDIVDFGSARKLRSPRRFPDSPPDLSHGPLVARLGRRRFRCDDRLREFLQRYPS